MGVQEAVLLLPFAVLFLRKSFFSFFKLENFKAPFQFSRHFEMPEEDQLRKVYGDSG